MTNPRNACAVLALLACGNAADAPAPPAAEAEAPVEQEITVTPPDSGAFVDFQWATRSTDGDTLRARLEAWLRLHGPIDGAFQDAVHRRYHRIAQFRLARAYYHAGLLARGDSLLAVLEDTDEVVR